MERLKQLTKAYDKRHKNPAKNYGIHGIDLIMALKGELGATQFVLYTNRQLPEVQAELVKDGAYNKILREELLKYSGDFNSKETVVQEIIDFQRILDVSIKQLEKYRFQPLPADLGYHSPVPQYEGQLPIGIRIKYNDDYSEELGTEGEARICEYLGKPCYYDGSGLNAERIYHIMLQEGEKGVWRELEEYYVELFGELK